MEIVFKPGTHPAVNADQFPVQVEKRAAGIPADQLAIRLNDAVLEGNHPPQAHHRAAFLVQAASVPQREHPVPHAGQFLRLLHAGKVLVQFGRDFSRSGVRIAVLRRGFSRQAGAVRQDDLEHGSLFVNDMGR